MENKYEQTVELDKGEILEILRRSKGRAEAARDDAKVESAELRLAINVIKKWAEENEQWLVVLAPWGMHHYGELTEEQVELILKRFSPEE